MHRCHLGLQELLLALFAGRGWTLLPRGPTAGEAGEPAAASWLQGSPQNAGKCAVHLKGEADSVASSWLTFLPLSVASKATNQHQALRPTSRERSSRRRHYLTGDPNARPSRRLGCVCRAAQLFSQGSQVLCPFESDRKRP